MAEPAGYPSSTAQTCSTNSGLFLEPTNSSALREAGPKKVLPEATS